MSYDLTGEKISFTYGRVVQVVSGSYYDGFGNPLPIGTSSVVITGSTSGFATTGSNTFIGNQIVSGSVIVTNGITGSLNGTSSYAISASYALTSSYSNTSSYSDFSVSSSYSLSSSYTLSSSYAVTASYALVADTATNATNAQNAQDILVYVKNTSGAIITKGHLVRIVGVDNSGNNPTIELADYRYEGISANTLGYTYQDFAINAFGYVMTEGKLTGVNTGNFTSGDLLYLSSSGDFTNVVPTAPNHTVRIGQVIRSQQNNGSIYVTIDNGAELDELHNVVDNTTTSSYGDLLIRSGSVWTNSKNLTGSYTLSGSLTTNDGINCISVTASLFGTSSWSNNSLTASYVNGNIISSSYALTASYTLNGSGTSLTTGSTYPITSSWANNVISSSYSDVSISSSYAPTNTNITASWSNNSLTASYVITSQTASYYGGSVVSSSYSLSSSFAPTDTNITASWSNNSINSLTASYVVTAQTASYYGGSVTSASYSTTSSYVRNAVSSSYSISSSYSVSASYAPTNPNITASYLTTTNNYTVNSLTSSNINTLGIVNINSSGSTSSSTNGSLSITGQNTKGGGNYHDFLYVTNTLAGAVNPNKSFRLNDTGNLEIINSNYGTNIFTLTDSGSLTLPVAQAANVTQLRNTGGGLKVGNYGHFFDDGNVHIHSTSPGTNLWLNCSGSGMFVVNGQTGASGGMCIGTGTQKGFVTIVGSVNAAITQPYGYLISSGAGSTSGTSPNPYSLTCDNRIMSSEFNVPSDERLKDIKGEISLNKAIDLVTKITPIEFTWKDGVDVGLKAGYSAQQTYKAGFEHLLGIVNRPGLEATTDNDGFTNPKDAQFVMNYEQVIPYHSKLIKHLLDTVEKLEAKIVSLENKLNS